MYSNKLEELQDNLHNRDAPLINKIAHSIPIFLLEMEMKDYKNLTMIELYNLFIAKTNIVINEDSVAEWALYFLYEMASQTPRHLLELQVEAENNKQMEMEAQHEYHK